MPLTDLFPVKVLFEPEEAFRGLAAGRTGWTWPLALYTLSVASAALLFTLLPPEYLADSFEGFTFTRVHGFPYNFFSALVGGLALTLFLCAIVSALARFLAGGRLSLRLMAAAALTGAFGLLAAALYGGAGGRAAAGGAAAAAVLFSARTAYSGRKDFPALLKAMLAVSALALAGNLFAGAAALAGSVKFYTAAEYTFSILGLYWSAKAVGVIYGAPRPHAAAAVVLGALCALAFLFLALSSGLLPQGVFEALLLI